MSTPNSSMKSRLAVWGGALIGGLALLYFLPIFHVVPLKAAREESAAEVFDPAAFSDVFWNERLLPSIDRAVDAVDLLKAFNADAADAMKRFGHRLGLSGKSNFFVSGNGRVVAMDGRNISISVLGKGSTDIVINTGPLFGNAIRDGSGLLDVSAFPNSRDFNDISSEINRRVEERVFPLLKDGVAVGVSVRFVGGVEIADGVSDPSPLKLVPVVVEFP